MNDGTDDDAVRSRRLELAGEWLIRLEEDALTESEVASWIEWCEADEQNLAAFESLQPLWHGARSHAPARREGVPRGWGARQLALAASVAVLAIATIFFVQDRWKDGQSRIAPIDLVQTPIAANRRAVLPDGSRVDIGARSVVFVDFASRSRKLQLRDGEAYFQVKHDRLRPFFVDVEGLRIVAIGTAFNVRRSGREVAVTVQEGMVEVRRIDARSANSRAAVPAAGDAAKRPLRASAGQQLVFDTGSGAFRESLIDPAVALAWRTGRLEFTGDSLQSVVASVNRYARRPIVLQDPALQGLTFTGTVFFDSIDAWLDSLPQIFPVRVDREGSAEIVLSRRGD